MVVFWKDRNGRRIEAILVMIKYVLAAITVTCLGTLGALIHVQSSQPARRPQQTGPSTLISAPGRIEGLTPELELRSQIAGRVIEVVANEGEFVSEGQTLVLIDGQQYVHEISLAQAELDLAEAQLERLRNGAREQECLEASSLYAAKLAELELAQLQLERKERLRKKEAIPQQELDDQRCLVTSLQSQAAAAKARADLVEAPAREDELQIAHARVAAAKARLESAKVPLDRTKLKSPISGQVLKVNLEPGELAGPASRQPAVIVADTTRYRVRAFVEELDAPRVEVGMKATIHLDGQPNQEYGGTVTQLSPRMSRKTLYSDDPAERFDTKTREVWIDLDDAKNLVVGLRVDVTIDPCLSDEKTSPLGPDDAPDAVATH